MFEKFFKPKKESGRLTSVLQEESDVENKPQEIFEINKDVITSSDIQNEMSNKLQWLLGNNNISTVLAEVEKFEEANKELTDKSNRLSSLGFTSTPSTSLAKEVHKKASEKRQTVELQQTEIELTKKYSLEYPSYKFVPDRIFNEVRDTYNLYTAKPDRYIKEIPTKNLGEIENFIPLIKDRWLVLMRYMTMSSRSEEVGRFATKEEANKKANKNNAFSNYSRSYVEEDLGLEITAPIDHFNLDKSEIKGREISDLRVQDPIVSKKVEGGKIIISVWDKEANIPEIKNEILN